MLQTKIEQYWLEKREKINVAYVSWKVKTILASSSAYGSNVDDDLHCNKRFLGEAHGIRLRL